MASAIPNDHGIAGEQQYRSGDFFTLSMGTRFKAAEPASHGSVGRGRSRPGGHHRSAVGDGRVR